MCPYVRVSVCVSVCACVRDKGGEGIYDFKTHELWTAVNQSKVLLYGIAIVSLRQHRQAVLNHCTLCSAVPTIYDMYTVQEHPEQSLSCRVLMTNLDFRFSRGWGLGQ